MVKLKRDSHQPLYVQMMTELKQMIRTKYVAGDKIPTESELAEMYGVSRITVRKTIEQLCQEGYLVKQQGKGTFVETPRVHRKIEMKTSVSFSEACRNHGGKPTSHVLSVEWLRPQKWQSDFLGVQEEERLIEVKRILSSDGIPIILEQLYLPESRFSDFEPAELENGSLYVLLASKYGFQGPPDCDSTIEAATADRNTAELLRIQPGEAILIMYNYQYDSDGRAAFISCDLIVGTRYRITI